MKTLILVAILIATFCITGLSQVTGIYDELGKIETVDQRKSLLRSQSAQTKIDVWMRNLDYALNIKELTKAERAAIEESKQYLTVEYFNGTKSIPLEWMNNIKTLFFYKVKLYKSIFEIPNNQHPVKNSIGKSCSTVPLTSSTIQVPATKTSNRPSECNCSWWLGGCSCSWYQCGTATQGCNQVINCGGFGQFMCTGTCYAPLD